VKNRRGPASALEKANASGVQPPSAIQHQNRKETMIERCSSFVFFSFFRLTKRTDKQFFGDGRKKRKKAKEEMAEKWVAEKWGERSPRCYRCVGEAIAPRVRHVLSVTHSQRGVPQRYSCNRYGCSASSIWFLLRRAEVYGLWSEVYGL